MHARALRAMQLDSLFEAWSPVTERLSNAIRGMRDRGRTFSIATNMTPRITVRDDAKLALANFHGLVIVADLQKVSGHHIQRRTRIEDVAVGINDRARSRIAFEALEIPDGAQDFHVAVNSRAFAFGPRDFVNQALPARTVNQTGTRILAHDVWHGRPVEVILDAEFKDVPRVIDRLGKNH